MFATLNPTKWLAEVRTELRAAVHLHVTQLPWVASTPRMAVAQSAIIVLGRCEEMMTTPALFALLPKENKDIDVPNLFGGVVLRTLKLYLEYNFNLFVEQFPAEQRTLRVFVFR